MRSTSCGSSRTTRSETSRSRPRTRNISTALPTPSRTLDGIEVLRVSDRTFLMHLGGKIEMQSKAPLKTRDDLSMAYTPGVARISQAIADDPASVWNLTVKQNTVAVVSDGTAVLGLGDIGPEAAMPVMEGKAVLFKEFGGVDAWPICLATKDPDEIVAICKAIAPGFGGHQPGGHLRAALLRDRGTAAGGARHPRLSRRSARHCDRRARGARQRTEGRRQATRRREDRDHGCRRGRDRDDGRTPRAGARRIVGCDHEGAVYRGRAGLLPHKAAFAERTNPGRRAGQRRRGARGRGRLHRTVCTRGRHGRRRPHDGAGRDRVRDGEPDARGRAGGARGAASRSSPRAGPTTPTRSTTSSRSPASSEAPSTSAPATITAGDGGRGGVRDRRRDRTGRARPRVRRPERVQPRHRATGGRGGRRGRGELGRRRRPSAHAQSWAERAAPAGRFTRRRSLRADRALRRGAPGGSPQ